MTRLSVAIDATAAGFNAALTGMEAKAKATAASIKSSMAGALDSTAGRVGGSAGQASAIRGVASAQAALTKARQAEARAAREVTAAEQKLTEVRRTGNTALKARNTADTEFTKSTRHAANVIRDADNEIVKSENAVRKAFDAREVAQARQAELDARLSGPNAARVKESTILQTLKASADAEETYTQAVRNNDLAQQRRAATQVDADSRIRAARLGLNEAYTKTADTTSAITKAQNSLANAQDKHVNATQAAATAATNLSQAQIHAASGSKQLDTALSGIAKHRDDLNALSRSMLTLGAVGAIGLGLVAKAAIDWEQAYAGVAKTVDFTNSKWGSTTAAMKGTELGLRGLAKVLPETHAEIAATAEVLGTLGVHADDLINFTRVAVQLGTTTNMSSEEAATGLAQLMTVMGESPKRIENVGSALVALGLDGASTERQIIQTSNRIAAAGKQVGFTTPDVLALGSALASTGIQAEAGGNNIATTLTKINTAVGDGGTRLEGFAKVAGMSADEFADAWGQDAPQALELLLDGLATFQKKGGDTNKLLRSLGINNVREIRNMTNLASATKILGSETDLYREQRKLANVEDEKGSKLAQVAGVRYQTDASKITIAWNNIKDAAITAGASILPVIAQIADGISSMAQGFASMSPSAQGGLLRLAGITAVALLVGGALVGLVTKIAVLRTAMVGLQTSSAGTAAALGLVGKAAATLLAGLLILEGSGAILHALETDTTQSTEQISAALHRLASSGDMTEINKMFSEGLAATTTGDIGFKAAARDIDGIGDAFERVFKRTKGEHFWDAITGGLSSFGNVQGQFELFKKQIAGVDVAMGQMVSSGHQKEAAAGFALIAEKNRQNNIGFKETMSAFPEYQKALYQVAEANGEFAVTEAEMGELMLGRIPKSFNLSGDAAKKFQGDLDAVDASAAEIVPTLDEVIAKVREFAGILLGLRASSRDVQTTFDNAKKTFKDNAKAVAEGTMSTKQAKIANEAALDSFVQIGNTQVDNMVKAGASQQAIEKTNNKNIKSFRSLAGALKIPKDQTDALVESFFDLPEAVNVRITTPGAELSKTEALKINNILRDLPPEVQSKLVVLAEKEGYKTFKEVEKSIRGLPPETQAKLVVIAKKEGIKDFRAVLESIKDKDVKVSVIGAIQSKAEADAINTALELIPPEKRAEIVTIALLEGVDGVNEALKDVPGFKEINITTKGDTKGADEVKEHTNGKKGPKDKEVKVTTKGDTKGADNVKEHTNGKKAPKNKEVKVTTKGDTAGAVKVADATTGKKAPKDKKVTVTADGKVTKGAKDAADVPKNAKNKTITITVKTSGKGVEEVKNAVGDLKNKTIRVTIKANTSGAKDIKDAISGTKNKTIRITIKANTSGAKSVSDAISGVKSKTITVKIKGDASGAKNVADAISGVKAKTVKVTVTDNHAGATNAKKAIDNVKSKSVKVTVGSDTSGATRARNAIANVHDKTVYITTVTKTVKRAAGGPVFGPGTATSDSIPALLSDGEFVIRAAAVKAIGMAKLFALNAQGYASGGPVGTPTIGTIDYRIIAALIKALTNPVGAVNAARARVTRDTPPAAADLRARDAAKKKADALNKEEAANKKAADRTKGKTKADKEYAKTKKESTAASNAYTKAVDKANKSTQKLKESQEALKQAQKELSDAARQVSTELATPYRSASNDIDDWLESMKTGQADLVKFQAQVVQLRKSGLYETLIQQIAAKGAIAGQELAGQILAGGKSMVDSLNRANSGLQTAADNLGYVTASGTGRYAMGGPISGPGTGTSDSVMIRASAGEYVVNAAASAMNRNLLDMINYGRSSQPQFIPSYAQGGYVNRPANRHTDYHAGDVNLYGVIGDPELWLRKAQQSKHDAQIMHGLQRQFV